MLSLSSAAYSMRTVNEGSKLSSNATPITWPRVGAPVSTMTRECFCKSKGIGGTAYCRSGNNATISIWAYTHNLFSPALTYLRKRLQLSSLITFTSPRAHAILLSLSWTSTGSPMPKTLQGWSSRFTLMSSLLSLTLRVSCAVLPAAKVTALGGTSEVPKPLLT